MTTKVDVGPLLSQLGQGKTTVSNEVMDGKATEMWFLQAFDPHHPLQGNKIKKCTMCHLIYNCIVLQCKTTTN